jgi:hypothetical protein
MKKVVLLLGLVTFLACTPKDKKFCECIQISKEFNELTQKGIAGELSKEELNKARQLQEKKAKTCAEYEVMGGEEMLKKKAACGFEE